MNGSGSEATLFRLQGAPACALTPLISQLPFKLFLTARTGVQAVRPHGGTL